MSRAGYSEDVDHLELYRASVGRAIKGKRGQKFLRELADALDAMPVEDHGHRRWRIVREWVRENIKTLGTQTPQEP